MMRCVDGHTRSVPARSPTQMLSKPGRKTRHFAHGGAQLFADDLTGPHRSVLIVDDSAESREVLKAALSRRGLSTLEACEARQGLDLLRRFHPDVVVLDLEAVAADDEIVRDQIDSEVQKQHSRLIVLGRA